MRGAWLGINLETDRAQLVRAVLEGIALRVVQIVRAMMADTALEIRVLRADGGLTNNAALMQLQADLLGYPVEVLLDPEATASGACYLAARQAGIWETDQQMVPHIRVARTYEPSLSADVREARLDRFDRAVKALATWQSDD
jgi:glycerol kinase